MKIELETHPGLILNDPTFELYHTLDRPNEKTFTPTVIFIDSINPVIRIGHSLPSHPYINNTWTDEDIINYVKQYLEEIKIKE